MRQLLQFMASRGSLETRRAGRRSIPICGLDILAAIDCETSVDIGAEWVLRQDASSGGERPLEHEQDVGKKQSTGHARCEMYVQIKASGSGDGQGAHGRQGLMSSVREGAPTPKRLSPVGVVCRIASVRVRELHFLRRERPLRENTRARDGDLGLSARGASNRWAEYKSVERR